MNTNTNIESKSVAQRIDHAAAWTAEVIESAAAHTYQAVVATTARTSAVVTECIGNTPKMWKAERSAAKQRVASLFAKYN